MSTYVIYRHVSTLSVAVYVALVLTQPVALCVALVLTQPVALYVALVYCPAPVHNVSFTLPNTVLMLANINLL